MEQKKSTAISWLVIGAVFILLTGAIAFLPYYSNYRMYGLEDAAGFVLGAAGTIFLIVGIVKVVVERFRK